MTSDETIRKVAAVLTRHFLGRPHGGTASGAFVLCGCGTVINGVSRDHAHAMGREHLARALAEEGLLAPAPLREEWGVRWDGGTSVMAHYLNQEEASIGAGDDTPVHRWVSEWEAA